MWILSFPQKITGRRLIIADFAWCRPHTCRCLDWRCSVLLLHLYLDYRDKQLPVTACNFLCPQVEQRGDSWIMCENSSASADRQTDRVVGQACQPAGGHVTVSAGTLPSMITYCARSLEKLSGVIRRRSDTRRERNPRDDYRRQITPAAARRYTSVMWPRGTGVGWGAGGKRVFYFEGKSWNIRWRPELVHFNSAQSKNLRHLLNKVTGKNKNWLKIKIYKK